MVESTSLLRGMVDSFKYSASDCQHCSPLEELCLFSSDLSIFLSFIHTARSRRSMLRPSYPPTSGQPSDMGHPESGSSPLSGGGQGYSSTPFSNQINLESAEFLLTGYDEGMADPSMRTDAPQSDPQSGDSGGQLEAETTLSAWLGARQNTLDIERYIHDQVTDSLVPMVRLNLGPGSPTLAIVANAAQHVSSGGSSSLGDESDQQRTKRKLPAREAQGQVRMSVERAAQQTSTVPQFPEYPKALKAKPGAQKLYGPWVPMFASIAEAFHYCDRVQGSFPVQESEEVLAAMEVEHHQLAKMLYEAMIDTSDIYDKISCQDKTGFISKRWYSENEIVARCELMVVCLHCRQVDV